jgi:DNA mismatch repair ATPase MutS
VDLRDRVVAVLRRVHDAQRLVQKFTMGKGDPEDLLALAQTISAVKAIVALVGVEARPPSRESADDNNVASSSADGPSPCLAALMARIDLVEPLALARRIRAAIDEAGITHQYELQARRAGETAAADIVGMDVVEAAVEAAVGGTDDDVLPALDDGVGTITVSKRMSRRQQSSSSSFSLSSLPDLPPDDTAADSCWMMRPTASPRLVRLHADLAALRRERDELQEALRARYSAPSLALKSVPSHGHVCHIRGPRDMRNADLLAAAPRAIASSRSTRTFHLPEWTSLGGALDHVRLQIQAEEQRVLHTLRVDVTSNLARLRRNAAVVDELDVAASFARLAEEQGLTRPVVTASSTAHVVVGGRHPTVEGGLHEQGRTFVRNDCHVGAAGHGRVWLITGPNMAGKSTFLRQNALITILAQIGCYVPADYAEIGIVDAIYSRVGSADNLYRDQSTFMVEMIETAWILRSATARSLVIMDEIGRGTTPEDGTAVAFASLHHLATVNRCRTLFATHFHAVADHVREWGLDAGTASGPVETYCNDVAEDGRGGFIYVHKLRRGINRESHALKVAAIAGLPGAAMDTARKILEGERRSAGDVLEEVKTDGTRRIQS